VLIEVLLHPNQNSYGYQFEKESTLELLTFTISNLLNKLSNNQIYHYVEQQEKRLQNNQQQQQIHSQVILPSTTITVTTSHQSQVPNHISRTNNLVGQKMTPWKSSSLLSTQINHHNTLWW
jgi:hypothetical protein